ncbi:prolipoprotein diacylglyceryl transferase [Candidatus Uhrbacteria bacterium]|nr:prolipoprotein diacylglyceryl transferase [Candidatus Uhrbacteria bacterium]MBD3283853.1 prolipoprotein diacylglyceryl transferase [Candidatus Uhrbacteria bacterium]
MSWQHLPEHLSPYILHTPWFSLHWYGLMYAFAYILIYLVARYRMKKESFTITPEQLVGAMTWSVVGLAVGARLFYVLFYEPSYYLAHPFQIIWPFGADGSLQGISGLSYHGGLLGIILSVILYCKKKKIRIWELSDLLVPVIPLGYTFGRIGNFINGELYGRVTDVPWAMVFPRDPERALRHPSQLYEAALEGLLIFIFLWSVRKKVRGPQMLGLYLLLYAAARIIVEFFREPDPQLGFIVAGVTMGQVLSAAMMIGGVVLLFTKKHRLK